MNHQEQRTKLIATGTKTGTVVCAAAVLSLAAVASAFPAQPVSQSTGFELRPPKPAPAEKAPVITSALLGAALSGAVIFAGLMPVKRSHQD